MSNVGIPLAQCTYMLAQRLTDVTENIYVSQLLDVIFIDNTVIDIGPRQYSLHNTMILNTYIFNTKFRVLVFLK